MKMVPQATLFIVNILPDTLGTGFVLIILKIIFYIDKGLHIQKLCTLVSVIFFYLSEGRQVQNTN